MLKPKMKLLILITLIILVVASKGASALLTESELRVSMDTQAEADAATLQAEAHQNVQASASKDASLKKSHTLHYVNNLDVNFSVNTTTNNSDDDNEIARAHFSNGRFAEIKVMPETASKTAIAHLHLKCGKENNCTIILKEVGEGNSSRVAYEVKATKHVKLFWIFNTTLNVSAEVDANTGKVVKSRWPWWTFLTIDTEESGSAKE